MTDVNYAILRTEKIKSFGELAAMTSHWHRTRPTPNSDPKRTKYNRIVFGHNNPYLGVKKLLREKNITKLRKNGVLAIEYVLAFSPEYLRSPAGKYRHDAKQRLNDWVSASIKWMESSYGENCVSGILHADESNYHMHFVVCPVDQRINKAGQKINRLNARGIVGGKEKLKSIQDQYALAVEHCGLKRGISSTKTKASHTSIRQYYNALNQSKELCAKVGLIAPNTHPDSFNHWQSIVAKLAKSLDKENEDEINKLKTIIEELVATNNRMQDKIQATNSTVTRPYF